MAIQLWDHQEILKMRRAALIVHAIHDGLRGAIHPGISTGELDRVALNVLEEHGAKSNFIGYYDYPAQTCISRNAVMVHGIPSDTEIVEAGDLVSMDCGAVLDGYHGDSAFSVVVPGGDKTLTERRQRLCDITEAAMWVGVAAMATESHVGDIGRAIDGFVTSFTPEPGIVEDFTGHGIGTAMHMDPDVLNYATRSRGPKLRPGMVLCIEPILTEGKQDNVTLEDGWTTVTQDGSDACHWEAQVALHEDGIWVLSEPDGGAAALEPFGITPVPLGE
nr:type I methionyl aminopeptidase [Neoactinobaculum massilliense]